MSMHKFPFMPMYWGEYLGATPHLTKAQHGAYLLLIAFHWQNGKLPTDEDTIRKIAKCSTQEWPRYRAILANYFDTTVLPWKHKRVLKEIEQAFEKTNARSYRYTQTRRKNSEYPSSSPSTSRENLNVNLRDRNGAAAPAQKPRHGQRSPRGRIWFDTGTLEFQAHADDYRNAHHGLDPPMQWDKTGAWFEILGENQ